MVPMAHTDQLLTAVEARDIVRVRELVRAGADLNARCDQGASVLFTACISGDVELVRLLLDMGADPNLTAEEPASIDYADKPLELVMQAQVLLDWDRYTPVYELLIERGATDLDGAVPSPEEAAVRFRNHMARQHTADANRSRPWWKFWT